MNRKNPKENIISKPPYFKRRPVIPDNKPAPPDILSAPQTVVQALKYQQSFVKVNQPKPFGVAKISTKRKTILKNKVPLTQKIREVNSVSNSSDESEFSKSARRESILQAFNELYLDQEDIVLDRANKGIAPRRENFKYVWNLDSDRFFDLLHKEECEHYDSEHFSCGLMADRYAKWHLELTSEVSEQCIGTKLVLDEILWKSTSESEKIEFYVNIQLLEKSSRKILVSCKSPEAIIFGKSDYFESYGWSDFLPYDIAHTCILQGISLQIIAQLDITGNSFPRLQSLTKSVGVTESKRTKDKLKSEDVSSQEFFDQETLLKNTISLWRSGNRSDVSIFVGDKEFKGHRAILRAQSRKFALDLDKRSITQIRIDGFDPGVVENGLEFMYATICPMFNDLSHGDELLRFGDEYEIYSLKSCWMNHIYKTLTIENSLNSLLFTHVHEADPRVITGIISFCQRNKDKIMELKEFKELSELHPGYFSRILGSDNKYVFTKGKAV